MRQAEALASVIPVACGLGAMHYAHQHPTLGMMISPGAGFLPFWRRRGARDPGAVSFVVTLLAEPTVAPEGEAPEEAPAAAASQPDRISTRRLSGVALPQTAGAAQLIQDCAAHGMADPDHIPRS